MINDMAYYVDAMSELYILKEPPNTARGRLGVCAFFGLVLSYGSCPFRELVLPSRR